MSPKFYFSLWTIAAAAALVTWLLGSMTMLALVVFGFLAFGLTFVGMMCVLPTSVHAQHELEHTIAPKPKKERAKKPEFNKAHTYAHLRSV